MADRILIVEDDEKLARMVELELTHEGYEVSKRTDGASGLEVAENEGFDLVLLDIMLPGLSGIEVLRRLRKTKTVPVILLTARDEVVDKVTGLDSGADDYITKPFAIEELLARIRAALRKKAAAGAGTGTGAGGGGAGTGAGGAGAGTRADAGMDSGTGLSGISPDGRTAGEVFTDGALTLDIGRHRVTYGDEEIELTLKEFELLHCLLENKGMVMTRDVLLDRVWGYDYIGESNAVDVYVRFLRSKIDEKYGIRLITTVRGVGYRLGE